MAFPFIWTVTSSFKPDNELFSFPPSLIIKNFTIKNYDYVLNIKGFSGYFFNSIIVSGLSVIINVLFCSMAGYAFAHLEFKHKNFWFFLLLATMMIPIQITLIPTFLIAKNFPLIGGNNLFGYGGTGLLNTYAGLIIPHIMSAFGVFMMRQFYSQIPKELAESARIDGASESIIFFKIFFPIGKSSIAALAIFTFTQAWDDFLWPLIITNDDSMRTLQLGLEIFKSQNSADWGPLMSATTLTIIPVLIIFIILQKYFIDISISSSLK
jgi:multiple sugar transport system permease protein